MPNLALRLISAAIGIPVLLFVAHEGGLWLLALVAAIQLLLIREWRAMAAAKSTTLCLPPLVLAIAGLDYLVFIGATRLSIGILILSLYLWILTAVFSKDRKPLLELGLGGLFLLYAAFPLALWMAISNASDPVRHGLPGALGILLIGTWLCDSAAYFVGRLAGKHRLFPAASPNKTIEGAVGGLLVPALLLPTLRALNLASPTMLDYIVFPLIVGVAGQIGDLVESLMKRETALKDTSSLIPGHGGFLDRFDSLLLSSPFFLAYLTLSTP
ncbi:MAG: phosphatidate cytidylyltransferase [Calditrichaeota bacterium]|nr:phosphatidate cytidylyltransferase [Calditrichota bacterium]MCB9366417.1 phosphatidate cytidylyltransferase [Calditrichota bacterium]